MEKHGKLIYAGIIAIIFIVAMIVFKDKMTFTEIVLAFTTNVVAIISVWKWLNAKEEKAARQAAEQKTEEVKKDFEQKTGVNYKMFKERKK